MARAARARAGAQVGRHEPIDPARGWDPTRTPTTAPQKGAQRRGTRKPSVATAAAAADGSLVLSAPEVAALDHLLAHPTVAAVLRRHRF